MRRLALVLALAGCVPAAPVPPGPQITLVPDAGGLGVVPANLRIDFTRAPEGVIPLLDRTLGPHEALTLAGCPDGVVTRARWGTLILTFTREQFVGWRQDGESAGRVCVT